MVRYVSTFTWDHNENLSCVFRNWQSPNTQDSKLHGYSLQIKIVFESIGLEADGRNVNPQIIKDIKDYIVDMFHFKTCVSIDDPMLDKFQELHNTGIIEMRTMDGVGLEKFAEHIFTWIGHYLVTNNIVMRLGIKTVEVREHSGSSSLYIA